MSGIVELIMKWAVPFLCGAIIAAMIAYIKGLRKRNSALEDGMQSLLRAEIIRSHEKYMAKGYCPIYAREALDRAYKAYHALHGNDVATGLYHDVMALPTEPPEEVKKGA